MSHRTAFSQEWPPPGPRGRSVHPEDNARGRRLDPPDSSSSVPLILRWMALILPLAQAIRWPRGLVGGRRVLDGAWSGRVGFGRRSIIHICTTASFENRTQRGSSREKARNPAESLALARLHPFDQSRFGLLCRFINNGYCLAVLERQRFDPIRAIIHLVHGDQVQQDRFRDLGVSGHVHPVGTRRLHLGHDLVLLPQPAAAAEVARPSLMQPEESPAHPSSSSLVPVRTGEVALCSRTPPGGCDRRPGGRKGMDDLVVLGDAWNSAAIPRQASLPGWERSRLMKTSSTSPLANAGRS